MPAPVPTFSPHPHPCHPARPPVAAARRPHHAERRLPVIDPSARSNPSRRPRCIGCGTRWAGGASTATDRPARSGPTVTKAGQRGPAIRARGWRRCSREAHATMADHSQAGGGQPVSTGRPTAGPTAGHLSRRAFIARVAALGLSTTAVGALLSACAATGGAPATTAPVAPPAVAPPAEAGRPTATAANPPTVAPGAPPPTPAAAPQPHNLAISPDGRLAYVAAQQPGATALVILDLAGKTQTGSVPLDKTPRALNFSPDGKQLYFTQAGVDALQVLDPATNKVVAQIPVGASPHHPLFAPTGEYALVVSQGPGELEIINPAGN